VAIPSSRGGHRLGLLHQVGDIVEDAVDPAREREQVLGLDGGDERLPERAQQITLGDIALALGVPHGLGRRRVAARPARESVHAVDGDRQLTPKHPEHIRGLGQEPPLPGHVITCHSFSAATPSAADTGMVISHARPMLRTTDQCT